MPFYRYDQNNSGGSFADDMPSELIVEAPSSTAADVIAQRHGVYFNGCDHGIDCSCCGDRWSPATHYDASEEPEIYGVVLGEKTETELVTENPTEFKYLWYEKTIRILYADDTVKDYRFTKEHQELSKKLIQDQSHVLYGFMVRHGDGGSVTGIVKYYSTGYDGAFYDSAGNRSLPQRQPGWQHISEGSHRYSSFAATTRAEATDMKELVETAVQLVRTHVYAVAADVIDEEFTKRDDNSEGLRQCEKLLRDIWKP